MWKVFLLNYYILERVYVKQPLGFNSYNYLNMFLNLKRHFMVKSKHLKLGMKDQTNFF